MVLVTNITRSKGRSLPVTSVRQQNQTTGAELAGGIIPVRKNSGALNLSLVGAAFTGPASTELLRVVVTGRGAGGGAL